MAASQQRLASRPAAAHDQPLAVRIVVIRQLLTPSYRPGSPDPDSPLADLDVAVRVAGVIDEPRDVAADPRVDDRAVGQLETPDVVVPDVTAFTLEAFTIRDFFAGVIDDARVLRDRARCVDTPSMDSGFPLHDHRLLPYTDSPAGTIPGI